MTKKFKAAIPRKKRAIVDDPLIAIITPNIEIHSNKVGHYIRAYKPFPRTKPEEVYHSIYTQHRQQDWGRAIALRLDPTQRLVSHEENLWTFQDYNESRGKEDTAKIYQFSWDGIGTPHTINFPNSYSTISGWPHKYAWAAWFIINGIPPWPPLPSLNPEWPFLPPWTEYTT